MKGRERLNLLPVLYNGPMFMQPYERVNRFLSQRLEERKANANLPGRNRLIER